MGCTCAEKAWHGEKKTILLILTGRCDANSKQGARLAVDPITSLVDFLFNFGEEMINLFRNYSCSLCFVFFFSGGGLY